MNDFDNLLTDQWVKGNPGDFAKEIGDDTFRGIYKALVYYLESTKPEDRIYAAAALKDLTVIGNQLYRLNPDPTILEGVEKLTNIIKDL